eukprot:379961_1
MDLNCYICYNYYLFFMQKSRFTEKYTCDEKTTKGNLLYSKRRAKYDFRGLPASNRNLFLSWKYLSEIAGILVLKNGTSNDTKTWLYCNVDGGVVETHQDSVMDAISPQPAGTCSWQYSPRNNQVPKHCSREMMHNGTINKIYFPWNLTSTLSLVTAWIYL